MTERVEVCGVDELPIGRRRLVQTETRGVVGVFNVNGRLRALKNVCPHRGAELCRGPVTGAPVINAQGEVEWTKDGMILRCAWHGWEFDIDTGTTFVAPYKRVATYPVTVEDGVIVLHVE
jgi:3-phenylpropionate/trans-cinnamate dioxygenase ferredoxin subunit